MVSVSKNVVENYISFFMKVMGVKKSNKRIRVTRYSVMSQNNAKNKQDKHQVKIYTIITLSLHLIPLLYYKTIKSMLCVLVVLVVKNN